MINISPHIQNEMLEILGKMVLRRIVADVQNALFYAIMVDETIDCSNQEQVVLVLRWVDDSLVVYKDFIGFYNVPSISADTLTVVIKDCLIFLFQRCVASAMMVHQI